MSNPLSRNPEHEHHHGEGHYEHHRFPTVQRFNEEIRRREEKEKRDREKRDGSSRVVWDPVTGNRVEIKDAEGDYKEEYENTNITVPRKNLVSPDDAPKDSELQHEGRDKKTQDFVDLPIHGKRSNVMFYTLPDPQFDLHHENVMQWFMRFPMVVVIGELVRYFIIDFGRLTAIGIYFCAGYWIREQMNLSWSAIKLDTVKRRADEALAKKVPESVEWLNAVVGAIWKQIDPDIFTPVVDKLEDVMQASSPSIVHAIKIDDVGHGDHPVRLLSMRYLDRDDIDEESKLTDDSPGEVINMEVSVAYAATPSKSDVASKVRNMHLLIVFFSGLENVLAIPVPVWVEVIGFIATIRLRIQFTPEFPYIKNTTFSLMGLPKFDISAVPLNKKLISVTNLPIISTFIRKSIHAACNEYVAPRSYSINVGQIIASDDVARECVAIGVLVVEIERADGLEGQNKNGLSNPYVVVSLSKYAKPIFSSRIIEKSLNPVFKEICFVLVTPEALRSRERLSIQMWNSDRFTADDENGRVEYDLQDLVRNRSETDDREDELVGYAGRVPGKIKLKLGYFSKRRCNHDLATDGSDDHLAEDLKSHPDLKDRRSLPNRKEERDVTYCRPDPDWPSGILHIQVHYATDLYADNPKGSKTSNMHYKQGQDTTNPEIEEDEAQSPSSYCNIILNDMLIYRTRTKPFSNKPYFNADTERFVRDWRTSACVIAVRDSRTREHDALLGVVPLKLSEVFKNASQVSKIYPVIGGVGEAKIRVSLLWESVDYRLPQHVLGWDVGNFKICSSMRMEGDFLSMKLKMYTTLAAITIRPHHNGWDTDGIELPATHRHSSAFCIEFVRNRKSYAVAIIWMTEMEDNEPSSFELPIWRTDTDEKRYYVKQNRGDIQCEQIGTLHFDAMFLRGLGPNHGKEVRDDYNLRQVHEAWQATVAHGQRELGGAHLVNGNSDTVNDDPYSEVTQCAENAKHDDRSGINHHEQHVDEEGRKAVDASAEAAVKATKDARRGSVMISSGRQADFSSSDDEPPDKVQRQGRGSMQFRSMRSLKWAKDGVRLGNAKLMNKLKMGRRPDIDVD